MIRSHVHDSLDGWARRRTTGPTGGWAAGERAGAVTPALTSRAAVTPRPVSCGPRRSGAGHGSRIGLRALILSHATFRCVGADDLVLYEHPV